MPCRYNPIEALLEDFRRSAALSLVKARLCTIYLQRVNDPKHRAHNHNDIRWIDGVSDEEFMKRIESDDRFKADVELAAKILTEQRLHRPRKERSQASR